MIHAEAKFYFAQKARYPITEILLDVQHNVITCVYIILVHLILWITLMVILVKVWMTCLKNSIVMSQ